MTKVPLIEEFDKRSIDVPIFDAVLKQGGQTISKGYARLYVESSGKYVIHVYGQFLKRPRRSSKRRTIPKSMSYKFTGRWENQWTVETEVSAIAGHHFIPTGYDSDFKIYPSAVTFTRRIADKNVETYKPSIEATVDKIDEFIWEKVTEHERRRSGQPLGFGMSVDTLDWTVDGFKIQLVKGDEYVSTTSICKHKSTAVSTLEHALNAMVKAVSLRLGRQIEILSSFAEVKGLQIITLNCRNKTRLLHKDVLPPVREVGAESTFLHLATAFFLKPENLPLSWYLRYFWDAEFGSWETRELCLGVAIELLAGFILQDWAKINKPQYVSSFANEKQDFDKAKKAILLLFDTSSINFKDTPYNRFYGSVEHMNFFHSREMLKEAGSVLGLSVTDEQTAAWSRMRNQSAHRKKKRPSFNNRIEDWMCCTSLLHRYALGLIGWHGSYVDYSKANSPIKPLYSKQQKPKHRI